jgi:hypothetical protein
MYDRKLFGTGMEDSVVGSSTLNTTRGDMNDRLFMINGFEATRRLKKKVSLLIVCFVPRQYPDILQKSVRVISDAD